MDVEEVLSRAREAVGKDEFELAVATLNAALEELEDSGDEKAAKRVRKELESALISWADDVNKLGDKLYREKQYKDAMEYYEQSLEILQRVKSPPALKLKSFKREYKNAVAGFAQEINDIGDKLFEAGNYEEAIEIYAKSVDLIEMSGKSGKVRNFKSELKESYEKLAERHAESARAALEEQEWEQAIAWFEKAAGVASNTGDQKLVSKYKQARLDVYAEWAKTVNKLGDEKFKAREYDQAIKYYVDSVDLARKSEDIKLVREFEAEMGRTFEKQAAIINKIADEAVDSGNYSNAIEIYQQSIEVARRSGNDRLVRRYEEELNAAFEKLAEQVNEMGDRAFADKSFEIAADLYQKSIELAKKSQKEKLVANFQKEYLATFERWADEFVAEGDAALNDRQFEKAVAAYVKALEKIKKVNAPKRQDKIELMIDRAYGEWAQAVNNEGDEKFKAKEYDEAFKLYNRSIELAEEADDQRKVKNFKKERDRCLRKMQ
ncbi:MAG: hypothetical protein ACTSU5_11090 [Promethearchaeota archaeon]